MVVCLCVGLYCSFLSSLSRQFVPSTSAPSRANGLRSAAVKRITFTEKDSKPAPKVSSPLINNVQTKATTSDFVNKFRALTKRSSHQTDTKFVNCVVLVVFCSFYIFFKLSVCMERMLYFYL